MMRVALDILLPLVAVLAVLPAARAESAPPCSSGAAAHDEGEEVGSLIQTVAEGKARTSMTTGLAAPGPKASGNFNFCRTDNEAQGDALVGQNVAEDAKLGKVTLAPQAESESPKAHEESSYHFSTLAAAIALGTLVARGIVTLQADAQDAFLQHAPKPQKRSVDPASLGIAPLFEAVRSGDTVRVAGLLKLGAAVNKADKWGCTPLHVAASQGDAKVVRALLDGGADPDAREAWDEGALHLAARAGNVEVCKLLLLKGATVNAINADDHTPLLVAALEGHRATCEALLDHGAGAGDMADDELPPLLSSLIAGRCLLACLGADK